MREVAVGETIDQYTLSELLARSGMASIFKAIDAASGQTVALKIPHPQLESDVVFFERFRREEKIGQKLDHPNIIKVFSPREKSRMYMAMECIDGRSLRALMQERRTLPVERALEIARQVTEALVYMHGQGVVHRDIKPENILLVGEHGLKILDFGIAMDDSARRLTWTGLSSTLGTPDYMAPEQIGGRRGDARTDVYAVGTLLYEMLTGELPFSNPNPQALMRAKTNDDPRPPSYHLPSIDPALEVVIMRAIARAPRDRYETAAALLEDLRNPSAARPLDPSTARGRARGVGPRRALVPVLVVAAVVGLISLMWLSRPPAPPARAPTLREK
ncbi:MAG TPA: serine/threonine-protein kinase [Polyangia bacterium]|jgi:serine/threonine protein kinase|nr:serine/threonine-protein kinase [Polyangia bacterium]